MFRDWLCPIYCRLLTTFHSGVFNVRVGGNPHTPDYETDSFERIQSGPSPLASDPDPVQSGLVNQKPIQSNPLSARSTNFVHCIKSRYTYIHKPGHTQASIWDNLQPTGMEHCVCVYVCMHCIYAYMQKVKIQTFCNVRTWHANFKCGALVLSPTLPTKSMTLQFCLSPFHCMLVFTPALSCATSNLNKIIDGKTWCIIGNVISKNPFTWNFFVWHFQSWSRICCTGSKTA